MWTWISLLLAAFSVAVGLTLTVSYWSILPAIAALGIAGADIHRNKKRLNSTRLGADWSGIILGLLGTALAFM